MKYGLNIITALLLLPALAVAQARMTDAPQANIIQCEDERTLTPELLDWLKHKDEAVRRRAILAVGRIGDPAGVAPLIGILKKDRRAEIRALAAFALGEIEHHDAAAALLDQLQPARERSSRVRARAAEALGKIAANRFSAEALGKDEVNAIAAALARLLPPTGRPLSEDERFTVSLTLTALLRLRQPSTIEAISGQLRSTDAETRWQAANALARLRDGIAAAVPALMPLLNDTNSLARAQAARALGVAKVNQAVAPLIRLLTDTDERVVASAINALGAIGDTRAVEPLVALGDKLLTGYRSFDRAKGDGPPQQNQLLLIATALGTIKHPRALPFLKSLRLVDGRIGSRPEVEIAVARFGETAFFDAPGSASLPKDNWKAVAAYAQGLGQLGAERARTLLLDLLAGQPDPRAVSDILNALAAVKVERLRDILLSQLKADDVIVRTTAATLLGEAGDSSDEVIKALRSAYETARKDIMNDARIAILEAADKLKHSMSARVLSGSTRDPDFVARLKAAEMLRQSGAKAASAGNVESGHDQTYYRRVAQLAMSKKNPIAVIRMKKGDAHIELFAADAPMTVDSFMTLARQGFFNGLTFMRVVPNFVIQGGDPRNDMNGGPGYQIRCEINERRYGAGTVGMALSGKDTGGSQFFITHSPQPHLDGGYTVFGQVVAGMDVVNRIARDDRIERIEIREPK